MGLESLRIEAINNVFQSTHPVWDGTYSDDMKELAEKISIHPSRVGWDTVSHGVYPV